MANQDNKHQVCGTLNRIFAAFFMNECIIKEGIDFEDSKPIYPNICFLNTEGHYFTEDDLPYGAKHFFHGRMLIEDFDFKKFMSMKIEDYIDNNRIKDKLTDIAQYFSQAIKTYQYCDFVFSSLPTAPPYLYDCILDPETNFRSRLVIGKNLDKDQPSAIWEFYCLLMNKIRKTDVYSVYGEAYKNVDHMTDEEPEKFNKKIRSEQ